MRMTRRLMGWIQPRFRVFGLPRPNNEGVRGSEISEFLRHFAIRGIPLQVLVPCPVVVVVVVVVVITITMTTASHYKSSKRQDSDTRSRLSHDSKWHARKT